MTDISKCMGENGCTLKDKCYRYTAPKGIMQSYISSEYKDGECPNFWNNQGRKKGDSNGD